MLEKNQMPLIVWKEIYQTGIVTLDEEHQGLVELINQLCEAIREKRGKDVLGEVLTALLDYTEHHFQHEEELMRQYGFPGLEEHQQIHQLLRDTVQEINAKNVAGSEKLAQELYKFLRGWLLGHIVEVDKKYGAYLESRGGRFIS
jgi:hemerythrin